MHVQWRESITLLLDNSSIAGVIFRVHEATNILHPHQIFPRALEHPQACCVAFRLALTCVVGAVVSAANTAQSPPTVTALALAGIDLNDRRLTKWFPRPFPCGNPRQAPLLIPSET
jgi:hypothetical protein